MNKQLTEHKQAARNGDMPAIACQQHHLQTNCRIDHRQITLLSWFISLEQMPLNQCQQLPAPLK